MTSNLIRVSARDPSDDLTLADFDSAKSKGLALRVPPPPPGSRSDVKGALETPQLINLPFTTDSTTLLGYQALLKDAAPTSIPCQVSNAHASSSLTCFYQASPFY